MHQSTPDAPSPLRLFLSAGPGAPLLPARRRTVLSLLVALAACGDSTGATAGATAGGTSTGAGPTPTSTADPSGTTSATDSGTGSGSASASVGSSSTADTPTTSATTATTTTTTTHDSTSTGSTGPAHTTGETGDGSTGTTGTPVVCAPELAPAGPIALDPACEGDPIKQVADPWNIGVEWSYVIPGTGAMTMPAVGPLTDDDADGDVDEYDTPAIAFSAFNNTLIVLHGDGSGLAFTLPGIWFLSTPAIADVDGDGAPEVVVCTQAQTVIAVDGSGTIEWTSPVTQPASNRTVTVSDLDEDGDVEVILDNVILDGATGALIAKATEPNGGVTLVADLDLDGAKEIVDGCRVFSSAGDPLWSFCNVFADSWSATADIDDDPEAELLTVLKGDLYVHEHDGTPIGFYPVPGTGLAGPICVADFDGDGEVEVGTHRNKAFFMLETDGTPVWQAPIQDGGNAGCSAYDFDADGAHEILYADEQNLWIFDGATGAVRYVDPAHESSTVNEYPVVADVDNDGSAEIVVTSYGQTYHRLTVYGHVDNAWSKSGRGWQVHDYAVTNVDPDGSVPVSPEPSWARLNVFRGRATVDDPALPDLLVGITETCVDCDSQDQVAYQVCNQGDADVAADVPLTLFALVAGVETVVETRLLPAIPAGLCLAGDTFVFDPALVVDGEMIVRLYDDGNGTVPSSECNLTNDQAATVLMACG